MGDLAADTTVTARADGTFTADVSADWEIWGPMGGYVAAIALRAAGAARSDQAMVPAAFSCHYYRPARFEPVDIAVVTRKAGRSATSQRVEISQGGKAVLDAMVWSALEGDGLEHDETEAPDVDHPDALPEIRELLPDDAAPSFPFWLNLEAKPIEFEVEWPPDGPRDARWREWLRFVPTAAYDDPWVDGCRAVILVDLPSWPAAHRPHAWTNPPYTAPTLDLNVAFHRPTSGHEWLLCDGAAPVSTRGLFGWSARVWSSDGLLRASGGGQCLYRRMDGLDTAAALPK
jgi:acyl-CoA thioesterase II